MHFSKPVSLLAWRFTALIFVIIVRNLVNYFSAHKKTDAYLVSVVYGCSINLGHPARAEKNKQTLRSKDDKPSKFLRSSKFDNSKQQWTQQWGRSYKTLPIFKTWVYKASAFLLAAEALTWESQTWELVTNSTELWTVYKPDPWIYLLAYQLLSVWR